MTPNTSNIDSDSNYNLSAEELAEKLGMSESFIYKNKKKFNGLKIGGAVRFCYAVAISKIKEDNEKVCRSKKRMPLQNGKQTDITDSND